MYNKKLGTSIENAIIRNQDDIKRLREFVSNGKADKVPEQGVYTNNITVDYIDTGMNGETYDNESLTYPCYYNNSLYYFIKDSTDSTLKIQKVNLETKEATKISIASDFPLTEEDYSTYDVYSSSRGTMFFYNKGVGLYEYDFINSTFTTIDISSLDSSYKLICTDDNKTLYLYKDYNNIKKYDNGSLVDANLDLSSYIESLYIGDEILGKFYFFQIYGDDIYVFYRDTQYIYKYKCINNGYKNIELECKFPKPSEDIIISQQGFMTGGWIETHLNKCIIINLKTNDYMIYQVDGRTFIDCVLDYYGRVTIPYTGSSENKQNLILVSPRNATHDNLATKKYVDDNKFSRKYSDLIGTPNLTQYAPIDSPDFTGDISMRRKSGTTVGLYSISLGDENEASGACSCAMGYGCVASQSSSIAIGYGLKSLSAFQCVLGKYNIVDSEKKYIHIIGNGKLDYDGKEVRSNAYTLDLEGNGWFKGNVSIDGTPTADNHLINKKYVDDAILQATTGGQIDLSGYAKSDNPVFTGALSMYRKSGTAVGQYSVALGSNATASGKKSVAIGDNVTASGSASFACGAMCTASGSLSHAEGFFCTAGADSSHAEGCLTQALGQQSHSEGNNTIANCNFQHVQGIFNIKDEDGIYAHIIGNGTADNARANIHTVAWDGKGWFKGDVYVGGTSQDNGKKLLSTADIYFDTDGNLCVTIGGVTKKFAPIG